VTVRPAPRDFPSSIHPEVAVTDPNDATTEPAPMSREEAAEVVRSEPALDPQSGADAATDDDARTADASPVGDVRDS
jgi:hypothetical protein